MIKKLHKIPDKVFFGVFFALLILWNLKYIDMPLRVAYSSLTKDIYKENSYYAMQSQLKEEIKKHSDFFDTGKVGFFSDLVGNEIFLDAKSIEAFYTTQYAVVPSVLYDNSAAEYVVVQTKNIDTLPKEYKVVKSFPNNIRLLKRRSEDAH